MPEQHFPSRKRRAWLLSKADETRQLLRIRCTHCRIARNYLPCDLQRLYGDLDVDAVERRLRCEACGLRDYMDVKLWMPTPMERIHVIVRKLKRIDTVKRPTWNDELLR